MRAEIAPRAALTLRTCGVMPAEGAMHSGAGALAVQAQTGVVFDGVDKSFGPVAALRGVSLAVARGEFVAVVGPSGCGKSTLLELVCGLTAPDAGRVAAPPAALMPQRDALLPWYSALDNAALALRVAGARRAAARARAHEHFAAFGLEGFEAARPAALSGGMRQRVAFLRTLLSGRPVLCLDEPFGALDALTRLSLQRWLAEALAREPRTVLLVTHDVEEAVLLADRVVLLSPRPGTVAEVLDVALPRPRARDDAAVVALRERALEVAAGVALALAMHLFPALRRALRPLVIGSQAVPVPVIAPLVILVLGFGLAPKVLLVALVCFFPITINLYDGLRAADPDARRLLRSLQATRWQALRLVEAPAALPAAFTGLKVAAAVAVIGAVFAEWAGAEAGLGHALLTANGQLETARAFAATLLLFLLAIALYGACALLERRVVDWTPRTGPGGP